MTLTLARELHNACPRCPQPTWHNGAPCPLWASAPERPRSVECKVFDCRATTFRNDGCCSDEHVVLYHRSRSARVSSPGVRVGGRVLARPVASISPAGALTDALHQPPVGGPPQ